MWFLIYNSFHFFSYGKNKNIICMTLSTWNYKVITLNNWAFDYVKITTSRKIKAHKLKKLILETLTSRNFLKPNLVTMIRISFLQINISYLRFILYKISTLYVVINKTNRLDMMNTCQGLGSLCHIIPFLSFLLFSTAHNGPPRFRSWPTVVTSILWSLEPRSMPCAAGLGFLF